VPSHNNRRWASQGGGGADAPTDHPVFMMRRNIYFQKPSTEFPSVWLP
jgi:hypothetical protein